MKLQELIEDTKKKAPEQDPVVKWCNDHMHVGSLRNEGHLGLVHRNKGNNAIGKDYAQRKEQWGPHGFPYNVDGSEVTINTKNQHPITYIEFINTRRNFYNAPAVFRWRCPVTAWHNAEHLTFKYHSVEFNSLAAAANPAKELEFNHFCVIKKLDLSSSDFPNVEKITLEGGAEIKSGLLSFLKLPRLKEIVIMNRHQRQSPITKDVKLFEIINKHLEDKDIAECMDELIEAGFEKYAKL